MLKAMMLWHPESPGETVIVVRGWFARLFYPREFATLGESLRYSLMVQENNLFSSCERIEAEHGR